MLGSLLNKLLIAERTTVTPQQLHKPCHQSSTADNPIIPGSFSSFQNRGPQSSGIDSISELNGRMNSLHLDVPHAQIAHNSATAPNIHVKELAFFVSGVTAQLALLFLEELAASSPAQAQDVTPAENRVTTRIVYSSHLVILLYRLPVLSSMDSNALEALATVLVLSATPINMLHHNKTFSTSTKFYKNHGMEIPPMESLEPFATLNMLHALADAKQKVQEREASTIQQLEQQFDFNHHQIFDGDFTAQTEAVQQTLLDEVNTWLEKGMITLRTLEEREQEWRKKQTVGASPSEPGTNHQYQMQEYMWNLFAKMCALYAPLIPTKPIKVDAGDHASFPCF
ncbi:hypothetical protein BT96DRAFT_948484 [Gymnopus androsaceus JB14]|uniref:Uncharacterized protein n=1 Tax=Gymnopus androsaceus JB14 TaxID=1447944 RepID=A0A6A4GPV6_9AGAR|nr:hypothetical protein BT96DRAFT_948484 [Gymnopus androsaceus JB14]